ncbi:MAG TPA: PAS domain S-box protein [Candidatus Kapabacteria bacterium]|nr:PAS domain S-box protein [Candidatus Kapabacteria bacterium]
MKILIVITDKLQNESYTNHLINSGYDVISTSDFIDAESEILEGKYDIIVSDYNINADNFLKFIDSAKLSKHKQKLILLVEKYDYDNYIQYSLEEVSAIVKDEKANNRLLEFIKIIEEGQGTSKLTNIDYHSIYKAIFQYSMDAIFIVDASTHMHIDANQAALELTGLTLDELKQKHTYDVSVQGMNIVLTVKESLGTADLGEVEYIRADGSIRTALLSVIPMGGNIAVGIAKDITERKEIQNKMEQSETTYRGIINEISELVYILDDTGTFIDVNKAVENLYGYDKSEILGKTPAFLSAENLNDLEYITDRLNQVFYGQIASFEFWAKTKRGKVFPKEVYIYPITYFGKKAAIAVARDISDRKASEKLLKDTIARNNAILDALPDIIFIMNRNYQIIDYSCQSPEMLLITPIEFLGKNIKNVLPQELVEISMRNIDKVLNEDTISVETYQLTIQNKVRFYEARYIRSGENEVLTIIRDISEQVEAEIALSENKNIFYTIINNAPFEIWARDKDMRCILENKLLKEHWGSIIGTLPQDNEISESDFQLWTTNNNRALNGEIVNDEVQYQRDNSNGFYQNIIAPIYDDAKRIQGIVGFNIDITERKNFEAELIKQKQKAEENDRLKTAFLQNISHEIRTPLNGIIGFSNLLQYDDISKDEIGEYIRMVQISSNRLIETINNIIDISKIQAGQLTEEIKLVSLNSLVDDIYQSYIKIAKTKEIDFKLIMSLSDENAIIKCDQAKVTQILNNLVNNAFKFTLSGKIQIGYTIRGQFIEFFVKDTGIGITPETKQLIFDRFTQSDSSISRSFEGIGLGLAICKGLVSLLNGKIWLESNYGLGTDFYFTIPYLPNKNIEAQVANNDNDDIVPRLKTVMIVEDDIISYKYLKALLKVYNIQIIYAENGEEAIYNVLNYPDIDLILMDIRMPKTSGLESTRAIKKINPDIPIIAQTAYSFNEERKSIIDAGCEDYLIKPINREQLTLILERYSII